MQKCLGVTGCLLLSLQSLNEGPVCLYLSVYICLFVCVCISVLCLCVSAVCFASPDLACDQYYDWHAKLTHACLTWLVHVTLSHASTDACRLKHVLNRALELVRRDSSIWMGSSGAGGLKSTFMGGHSLLLPRWCWGCLGVLTTQVSILAYIHTRIEPNDLRAVPQ